MKPVRRFAIKRLIKLSRGRFTQDMLDDLVRRAAAGDVPAGAVAGEPSASEPSVTTPSAELPEWEELITPGRFTGKTVIVTGAGSGIGRATALRVAREGGRVVAVDISEDRLAELTGELPDDDIVAVRADITDSPAVAQILQAADGNVDGVANVAGIMDNMTPVHEVDDDVWQRVFSVNVDGTMKMMRAVLPGMLERTSGSIVNVASEASFRGSAAGAAYTASKHAIVGLTKNSAFMYGPRGIRVNAVAPGPTITNIEATFASELGTERIRGAMAIMPDAVEAEAVAASITFLLSDDSVNINGAILPSDGGWSAA